MWDGSSKVHYFIDFWHPFCWRLWRTGVIFFKKLKGHPSTYNSQTTFKPNLTCIFLSARAKWSINVCNETPFTTFSLKPINFFDNIELILDTPGLNKKNKLILVDTDYDHWAISYLFKDSNARISPLFSATLITFCKPILALLRYLSTKCKLILNTFSYKPMILQNLIRFLPTNKLEFYLDRK